MSYNPIVVASHPRSGTHLVIDLLRRQFSDVGGHKWPLEPNDYLYVNLERFRGRDRKLSPEKAKTILNRAKRPVIKTHFDGAFESSWVSFESERPPEEFISMVEAATKIYVVRDIREVMASYIQFLSGIDETYASMPLADFIHEQTHTGETRLDWWKRHTASWASKPNTLILSYKAVVSKPKDTLEALENHLQLKARWTDPVLPPPNKSIAVSRLNRIAGWSPSSTAILADTTRFKKRDWKAELDDTMIAKLADTFTETLQPFQAKLVDV